VLALVFGLSSVEYATAGAEDEVAQPSDTKAAALYVVAGDECDENYADELASVGLVVKTRRFETLKEIGRITGIPTGIEPDHLLLVNGYVLVNHVAPGEVVRFVEQRPDARGLVGSASCATVSNHDSLHAQPASRF